MTKSVTAPVVLDSIEKALAGARCRQLAETQKAVIAGVLAVWLQKAKVEGGQEMADIIKRATAPREDQRPPIARWGGLNIDGQGPDLAPRNSLRGRLKSANNR